MIRNKLACACVMSVVVAMSIPVAMAVKPADSATLPAPDTALQVAINGNWRDRVYVQRDQYRHPGQTLAFFGIKRPRQLSRSLPAVVGIRKSWRRICARRASMWRQWSTPRRRPKAVATITHSARAMT